MELRVVGVSGALGRYHRYEGVGFADGRAAARFAYVVVRIVT